MPQILTVTLNPALDLSTETEAVEANRKLRCAEPRIEPGGGGINVSRAIRFLGGPSRAVVALGGPTGEDYARRLEEEGGIPTHVLTMAGRTRQSVSVVDQTSGDQFRFVLPGPKWSGADCARAEDLIAEVAAPGDILVGSGSLPPGVPEGFFCDLNALLAATGVRIVLDTSGPALRAAVARRVGLHCLRMDHAEAEELAGQPLAGLSETAGFARDLHDNGVARLIAIARGAEGTVIVAPEGIWHCAPPKVRVVSAVGAGDSFVAGFVMGLRDGLPAEDACARGVAAAAAAVTTPDTQLCDAATAGAMLEKVKITPLAAG